MSYSKKQAEWLPLLAGMVIVRAERKVNGLFRGVG
jgi:hypothetical protein